MLKLALNFICKNEGHVIENMLESSRPITDLIVAVDTGSTDDTISIIQAFGEKYRIPTFVFQRPFDNFGNSRNYALDKLRESILQLGWDPEKSWGFFLDCDETLHIDDAFRKDQFDKDIYNVIVRVQGLSFQRQMFFHLSKNVWWEAPIHELIRWEDPTTTLWIVQGLHIYSEPTGASWSNNLEEKFLTYARLLTKYIEEGHETVRWLFYIGDSYSRAANYCESETKKRELRLLAKEYYEKTLALETPSIGEKIKVQQHIGEMKLALGEEWYFIQKTYLTAFAMDPRRAESIATIIRHYMIAGHWEIAYIFSSFAKRKYHGKNISGQVSQSEDCLYQWKILLFHYTCSYQSGRIKEAKSIRSELENYIRLNAEYLSKEDSEYIEYNLTSMNFPSGWKGFIKKVSNKLMLKTEHQSA